jgi:cytochrome c oxidase assembly protein subunit 15
MPRKDYNPWLHRYGVLTALATLALIGLGGLVTSHGAGMAVPDWPTTYGYNMFLFPFSQWVGGIFYEHTHRLAGAAVGLLTLILAVWLWLREPRAWLRWLGVAALFCVMLQGVLGGLRVVLLKNQLGIIHAALAQLFLVLVCAIALYTSGWWRKAAGSAPATETSRGWRRRVFFATLLIFGQLMLGAAMRHQHAGLAIPDFPLAYGKLWPATDAESLARYNQRRVETSAANPITAWQIVLQMSHRIAAMVVLGAVASCAWLARGRFGACHLLSRLSLGWLALILAQVVLGAVTIWSNKAADIATLHVIAGAVSLVAGAMLCLVLGRMSTHTSRVVRSPGDEQVFGGIPFDPHSTLAPNPGQTI